MVDISISEIWRAKKRLSPVLHHTELDPSSTFSGLTGGEIYLKCENRQKTGSFKIRGASNKIACMMERGESAPVVASSAGNHAQGVAYAAHRFGLPATIVMPKAAPIVKVQATEGYGAKVVLAGDCYDDAYAEACRICQEEGAVFLHPYNDLEVIAGQGTLGLEILEDLPDTDIIVVPAGGGGLLAGVAAAVKLVNPAVKVYGVQAKGADAIARSYAAGKLVSTESASTIADGIAVKSPGDLTVPLIQKYADDVVTVSDTEIADAILQLMERCKQIVEPAGAASAAAVISGKLDVAGKKVVCLLSGGNIDVTILSRVIDRGLQKTGRLAEFTVALTDKPGEMSAVSKIISKLGANVVAVSHDRADLNTDINSCYLRLSLETRNHEHIQKIKDELAKNGYRIVQ